MKAKELNKMSHLNHLFMFYEIELAFLFNQLAFTKFKRN